MTESLIENISLIQGDSSDLWYIKSSSSSDLTTGGWSSTYVILDTPGGTIIQTGPLALNDGSEGYTPNSRFVFQITPVISGALVVGTVYYVAIEIKNTTLNYNKEIAHFKLTIKPQWIV